MEEMVQYVSCSTYLIRCCVLLLLLLMTLLQIGFFTLIPKIQLYPNYCHNHTSHSDTTIPTKFSQDLQVPMHLFYQSLYLSPSDIEKYHLFLKQKFYERMNQFMEEEKEKEEEDMTSVPKQTIRFSSSTTTSTTSTTNTNTNTNTKKKKQKKQKNKQELQKEEENIHPLTKGFLFSHEKGQGLDEINSTATYCINIIVPFKNNGGIKQDYEMYLNHLPSSRLINGFQNPLFLPPSVIDLYLERHPVDTKYYSTNFHFPHKKTIWMMQNIEFFDRHELEKPIVGVIVVKNRIGLQKTIEYRHRHRLRYLVFYTKHTSHDIYNPLIQKNWNRFLHLAGLSPFKNTKKIIQAWSKHPEWPELVLRVRNQNLCEWIEKHFGIPSKTWSLANVDYQCGSMKLEDKIYLQNSIGMHLCPSETEGFGHYINEARSTGALILTTNVPPMNELVEHEKSGFLIGKTKEWWWQTKGDLFMPLAQIEIEEIEKNIEKMIALEIKQKQKMGIKARAKYLQDRVYFLNAMEALEESLCHDTIDIQKIKPYLY